MLYKPKSALMLPSTLICWGGGVKPNSICSDLKPPHRLKCLYLLFKSIWYYTKLNQQLSVSALRDYCSSEAAECSDQLNAAAAAAAARISSRLTSAASFLPHVAQMHSEPCCCWRSTGPSCSTPRTGSSDTPSRGSSTSSRATSSRLSQVRTPRPEPQNTRPGNWYLNLKTLHLSTVETKLRHLFIFYSHKLLSLTRKYEFMGRKWRQEELKDLCPR